MPSPDCAQRSIHQLAGSRPAAVPAFAKVGPVRGGRFFAWVLDGASPDERTAVTSEVPGPVLAVITVLFGRSYRKDVAPVWRS